jgi:foldase protein PrsA
MPRTKKAAVSETKKLTRTKAAKSSSPKISISRPQEKITNTQSAFRKNIFTPFLIKRVVLVAIIIGVIALVYSLTVAATVNGKVITTFELNQRLNKLHKETVLSQIINEKIVEQEANKKGIKISDQQVHDKIAELENTYGGGEVFNGLLEQQGLTREEFTRQTKLQLIVEELYKSESSPSAEEVQQFMDENKDNPEASDEAKFRQTAIDSLKQQKLSEIFTTKFQELKASSNIKKY